MDRKYNTQGRPFEGFFELVQILAGNGEGGNFKLFDRTEVVSLKK